MQQSLQDNLTSASRSSVVERGRLSRTNNVAMTFSRWWKKSQEKEEEKEKATALSHPPLPK